MLFSHPRWKEAQEAAEQAIRLAPSNPNAYRTASEIYRWLDLYQEAIASLTQAVRLQPGRAKDYRRRASLYFWQGRFRLAADLQQALRLDLQAWSQRLQEAARFWQVKRSSQGN
ncbi:hypothetical protein [Thermogemmatispora sp.]|uniref:hypothetical protein n=1 Tax=Thermogemmatispora sp. TaxID=1968838 RepID=UPI001DCC45A0|nr:hypothetical protein [Thermogemmatispora sp.]MBX5449449.1 hypothetical protein [Thermogemmatispora sp.]